MFLSRSFLTAGLFALATVAAPISINIASKDNLNFATTSNLNNGLYRDGGGGGCVDGLCVIGFSDTTVCNGDFQMAGAPALSQYCKSTANNQLGFNSFAHNSFSTFDAKDAAGSPIPPNRLHDFGKADGGNGQLVGPVLGPETAEEKSNGAFTIWPNSGMIPLDEGIWPNSVVGVANALTSQGTAGGTTLYNTMYAVAVTNDVPDGQNMPASRIMPKLFNEDENLYGTYSVMAGRPDDDCGVAPNTPCLYLFARNGQGPSTIKVARVPQKSLTDLSQYRYWDESTWSTTQPSVSDTKSGIVNSQAFMDTGEFFWSPHYNSFVHVSSALGAFTISYANDPTSLTSGWSEPQTLYNAQMPSQLADPTGYLYAGHSYPDWDKSGQSLLLSWTADAMWTQMAVVNFT